LWTNACCSHPLPNEDVADAARRRLAQEMGIACALEPLFVFHYHTPVPGGLIENEVVHVFGGRHDGAIKPDPNEVSEWKWINFSDLIADLRKRPDAYTVWFRKYVDQHGDMIRDWLARQ
jgi:isopentenyl-diphosphate delta-isomerase